MLHLISSLWVWLPGPLAAICIAVSTVFFLLLFAKLLKILIELASQIIGFIKTLLLKWGIGL